MPGNRKHGFMRGSKAGRNGFGASQGFYCDACGKDHGPSVERTGVSQLIGEPVLVCDKQYFAMKTSAFLSQGLTAQNKAIAKLKRLKPITAIEGAKGQKARIDFIVTVFIHGLKDDLHSYCLFDEHNIGDRDFDTCLEMFDGNCVVHGVIKKSHKNYWLKLNLRKHLGVQCYQYWLDTYVRVEKLNAQQSLLPVDDGAM